jgi:hypothetical protein
VLLLVGLALTALAPARRARAQRSPQRPTPPLAPELRLDAAFSGEDAVLVGAGVFADAGLYARLGLVVAGGVARVPRLGDDASGTTPMARIEALARFHLDPQRLSRNGIYAGGGVAVALRESRAPRYGLVALLGLEGAPRGAIAPAVEVGLGGGVRVAVALRRARQGRR